MILNNDLIKYLEEKIKELKKISDIIKTNNSSIDDNRLIQSLDEKNKEIDEIIIKIKESSIYEDEIIKEYIYKLEENINKLIINRKKETQLRKSLDNEFENLKNISTKIKEQLILAQKKEGKNINNEFALLDSLLNGIEDIRKNVIELSLQIPESAQIIKDRANLVDDKISALFDISLKEIEKIKLISNLRESLDNEFENLKNLSTQIKDNLSIVKQKAGKDADKEINKFNVILENIKETNTKISRIFSQIPEKVKFLQDRANSITEKANSLHDISVRGIEKIKLISNLRESLDNEFENLKNLSIQIKESLILAKEKGQKLTNNDFIDFSSKINDITNKINSIFQESPDYIPIFKNRITKINEQAGMLIKICQNEINKKPGRKKSIVKDLDNEMKDFGNTFYGLDLNEIKPPGASKDTLISTFEDIGKTFDGLDLSDHLIPKNDSSSIDDDIGKTFSGLDLTTLNLPAPPKD
ncbi:MAG: hypothetical protein HQK79_18510 [Desulfobacterales bacterium]|nr:hypothetical protein [Desulfobacterales bacterium]